MNNEKNDLFATKWYPDMLISIVAIAIYCVSSIVFYIMTFQMIITIEVFMFTSHLFSIAVMVSLFIIQKKKFYPAISFNGFFSYKDYQFCLLSFIILFFLLCLFSVMFNISGEVFLSRILENKSQSQIVLLCVSIVVLAPILEEFLFRHFLLSIIPFNLGGKWAAYAIVFSALIFSLLHTQYVHTISFIFIFIIGMILALARIISQGLLLPILLHVSFNFLSLMLYFLLQ